VPYVFIRLYPDFLQTLELTLRPFNEGCRELEGADSFLCKEFSRKFCNSGWLSLLYLCDNQSLLKAVTRWIGEGGKATLVGSPDADILAAAIKILRKKIAQGQQPSWSK